MYPTDWHVHMVIKRGESLVEDYVPVRVVLLADDVLGYNIGEGSALNASDGVPASHELDHLLRAEADARERGSVRLQ
jgi:hypothetical protein